MKGNFIVLLFVVIGLFGVVSRYDAHTDGIAPVVGVTFLLCCGLAGHLRTLTKQP